jgi:hypothetical protein
MGFGVLIHRSDSIYDDSPAERYQFPRSICGGIETIASSSEAVARPLTDGKRS